MSKQLSTYLIHNFINNVRNSQELLALHQGAILFPSMKLKPLIVNIKPKEKIELTKLGNLKIIL